MTDHDLLIRIDERLENVEKTVNELAPRVGELRESRAKLYGIASVLSFASALLAHAVWH